MNTTTRLACLSALLGAAIGATASVNDRKALQVNDDNGRAIGLLAPATGGPYMVALFDRGVRGGPVVAIPLAATRTSARLDYYQDFNVFFSNSDCTGTAYFYEGVAGVRPAAVVSISGNDLLYVADSIDVDEQDSMVQSRWLSGTCYPGADNVQGTFKASKAPVTLNFVRPFKVK